MPKKAPKQSAQLVFTRPQKSFRRSLSKSGKSTHPQRGTGSAWWSLLQGAVRIRSLGSGRCVSGNCSTASILTVDYASSIHNQSFRHREASNHMSLMAITSALRQPEKKLLFTCYFQVLLASNLELDAAMRSSAPKRHRCVFGFCG